MTEESVPSRNCCRFDNGEWTVSDGIQTLNDLVAELAESERSRRSWFCNYWWRMPPLKASSRFVVVTSGSQRATLTRLERAWLLGTGPAGTALAQNGPSRWRRHANNPTLRAAAASWGPGVRRVLSNGHANLRGLWPWHLRSSPSSPFKAEAPPARWDHRPWFRWRGRRRLGSVSLVRPIGGVAVEDIVQRQGVRERTIDRPGHGLSGFPKEAERRQASAFMRQRDKPRSSQWPSV